MANTSDLLSKEAISALESGRLIEAIKITRVEKGMGLKESKMLVDAYLDEHPSLKTELNQNTNGFGKLFWMMLIGAALGYYLVKYISI